MVITAGNRTASINSNGITSSIKLTNPAKIYEGTTMVPIRFISESLATNIE
ncbi:stalk domain-containing protein [Ureibacillus aquaedulcis]|uniref:stalk domain-containing protein n=1 Tax=Ureibacillus aquaedulcis TaxID=3058421 RepID=UPI003CE5875F